MGATTVGGVIPRSPWRVGAPRRHGSRLEFAVARSATREVLWFEVEPEHASVLSPRSDAAALALLLPAMAAGADLVIEGGVSPRLLYHLQGPVQTLTLLRIPSLRRVTVTAPAVSEGRSVAAGVGLGFSAGVDSWHALLQHAQAPAFAVTHLTFHDVGSHDGVAALMAARRSRVERIAARVGLPLVVARSNMDDFYRLHPPLTFVHTDAIRNVAMAHALSGGLGRFLYASATDYRMIDTARPWSSNTEHVAIPMFASEGFDPVSVGGDVSRPAKLARLAESPLTHTTLDVCIDRRWLGERFINCSRCGKCARTMATLDVLGLLPRYAAVFDLTAYERHRAVAWAGIIASPQNLAKEVVRLARERGYRIPPAAWALHAIRGSQGLAWWRRVRRRFHTG